jgi:hypothetical protein
MDSGCFSQSLGSQMRIALQIRSGVGGSLMCIDELPHLNQNIRPLM